jgi:hypothetical protein
LKFFQEYSKNILKILPQKQSQKETGVLHVIPFAPLKYFKLANIAIIQVLGSIENEQLNFNFLASCKSKSFIMNSLATKA